MVQSTSQKRRLNGKARWQSVESSTPTGAVRKKLLKSCQRPSKPASRRDSSKKMTAKSRDDDSEEMDISATEAGSNKTRTTPVSAATVSSATKLKLAAFSADVVVCCVCLSAVCVLAAESFLVRPLLTDIHSEHSTL